MYRIGERMNKRELKLLSSNGHNVLRVKIWEKEGISYCGILQISHGMQEHVDRYDEMACYFAGNGYIVVANDHLGHGRTAKSNEELGFFPAANPAECMVRDLYKVTLYMKKHYKNLPYFLLGHSMGSFLVRSYLSQYGGEINGAILVGTGNMPTAMLNLGGVLVRIFAFIFGWKHRSLFMSFLMFGDYNRKFSKDKHGKQWLTKDMKIVEAYRKDEYCMFLFTLNGVKLLIDLLLHIQKRENIEKIPKELPIRLISGDADPVGHFGKDIRRLLRQYRMAGIKSVSAKLYHDDRHELLNETDRPIVYRELYSWMGKQCKRRGTEYEME